jgi:hypothetical protein
MDPSKMLGKEPDGMQVGRLACYNALVNDAFQKYLAAND